MNNKHKKHSIASLAIGYTLAIAFGLLIYLNQPTKEILLDELAVVATEENRTLAAAPEAIAVPSEVIYIDRPVYADRLTGDVIASQFDQHTVVVRDDHDIYVDSDRDIYVGSDHDGVYSGGKNNNDNHRRSVRRDRDVELVDDVDFSLLDRRLVEDSVLSRIEDDSEVNRRVGDRSREAGNDLSQLTIDRGENKDELSDVTGKEFNNKNVDVGYGTGNGGELYAYNFPSYGVGAGVGSGAVGAGTGLGAGISAGIGEGVMTGETVPTLGGVGSYGAPGSGAPGSGAPGSGAPGSGAPGSGAPGSGTGGLSSGAGAGAAAGLITGKVIEVLGIGAPGVGVGGEGGYNYDHLPEDGALHIMMHVDGSGSILNTRKQLDIMKDTLLKTALLPYYNNDEELYNRRVTIISSAGERTLKFFEAAAKKDNVLAIAFQDEAQPAYHLPNFNKQPEEFYLDDLNNLKASLNGYKGVYRGVLFQVDRGKTFAKSFKEFVGNSFRGEGYLDSDNLKKYYRDNNTDNIRNKDGIVFSDEYHAKDSGDPRYYLDLIIAASKKVGLDLNTYKGGLTDGTHTTQQ